MLALSHVMEATTEEGDGDDNAEGDGGGQHNARAALMMSIDEQHNGIVIINATGSIMMVNQVGWSQQSAATASVRTGAQCNNNAATLLSTL